MDADGRKRRKEKLIYEYVFSPARHGEPRMLLTRKPAPAPATARAQDEEMYDKTCFFVRELSTALIYQEVHVFRPNYSIIRDKQMTQLNANGGQHYNGNWSLSIILV